ncbi:MAG TPA: DUF692 domain-containing protein [Gemmataceae bacterium]|nr:DUF692 domain-containing protein [Gemmataceae bacterium]
MNAQQSPLGLGIGWRGELALAIDRRRDLGFVEMIAEDLNPHAALPAPLQRLRERGVKIVPHGISLSLGSADSPDPKRLQRLDRVARQLNAPLVSEHLAFVRGGGIETGHLQPVPRTWESLEVVVANVREAKQALSVPLALENVATLFEWPGAELEEADFLAEVLEQADVGLLLDIENVYANARNHHDDPLRFLDRIPVERIAYVHIAGGVERDGIYHDTHAHPIPMPVLDLLEEVCSRTAVPGVMLERDDYYPTDDELNAELDAIAAAVARGAARREASHALR